MKDVIYEFILLSIIKKLFSSKKEKSFHYYTLAKMCDFKISNINTLLLEDIKQILEFFKDTVKKKELINKSTTFIERNSALKKYKDITLYSHQKQLFTLCKQPDPKLILYQAPTGTGKTISPLGLAQKHRIIFVCAAKHVGLQLAKSCISMGIKIAVAFGCEDPGGIRLHYFAAKDYVKNRRTGGIFRVDNSVGDKVQIIISDIMSYLPSMNYMLAFNKKEDIIWFWDEPTITLDYKTHEYHALLEKNWKDNVIPNVVLSSATLPQSEDIGPCLHSFISTFNSTNIHNIVSHDCTRTIPILDTKGYVVLPHYVFSTAKELKKSLRHIKKYKTLLRHFELKEISEFIIYVNKKIDITCSLKIENYFDNIKDITSISIKEYYLKLLSVLKENYEKVYRYFMSKRMKMFDSTIKITTEDSYTLTDGPTIYLADNVEKIAKYCLLIAKLPQETLDSVMKNINFNDKIRHEVDKIEKELSKNTDVSKEGVTDKKDTRIKKMDGKEQQLSQKCEFLRGQIRNIQLPNQYIPNSWAHLEKWNKTQYKTAFKSTIGDGIVERIMLLDVGPIWKILLMMGIGVFTKYKCVEYVTIMKELAYKQQLYMIIASTDYIYGTNYQFCHGYIGKDLGNLTQEKLIQAFGRVGRKNTMANYSLRLRNDDLILRLFSKSKNNTEVDNMNRLFGM